MHKTKSIILAFTLFILSGCSPDNKILLRFEGELHVSEVHKYGEYCWASWYGDSFLMLLNVAPDKIELHRDGTAHDSNLNYKWTLATPGNDNKATDQAWFDMNCKEPPSD